jgi:hypothetical protein
MELSHVISETVLATTGFFTFYVYLRKLKAIDSILWGTFILCVAFACSSSREIIKNEFTSYKDNTLVREDFKKHFDKCGVEGSIALYDNTKNQWMVSDTTGIHRETLPASTFKVINLLIALETKTIQDENEVVKWVGTTDTIKYGYRPEIYQDITVGVLRPLRVRAYWLLFLEFCHLILDTL